MDLLQRFAAGELDAFEELFLSHQRDVYNWIVRLTRDPAAALERLRSLLRAALPPMGGREPREDLWPRMLERLDRRSVSVPWFDFALGSLAAAALFAFPEVIPWVLLQC